MRFAIGIVLACILGVIVLIVTWRCGGDDTAHPPVALEPRPAVPTAEPIQPIPEAGAAVRNAEPDQPPSVGSVLSLEGTLTVLCVDGARRPVPDASVARIPASQRYLADAGRELGRTDSGGALVVPAEALRQDGRLGALRATADAHAVGYASDRRIRAALEGARRCEIAMRDAYDQEFRFRTETGEAVAGARVFLSRCRMSDRRLPASSQACLPAGDLDSVHMAEADTAGTARLRGLARGTYHVAARVPSPWALFAGPERAQVVVPGEVVVFEARRPVVAALRVEGDDVVSWTCRPLRSQGARMAGSGLDALQKRLAREWGTPLICARFPSPRGTPSAAWRILLEKTGWRDAAVVMLPLGEQDGPHLLEVGSADARVPLGGLRVQWEGAACDAPAMDIGQAGPNGIPSLAIPVEYGRVQSLPAGVYSIAATQGGWWRRVIMGSRVEVVVGQVAEHRLRLPDERRACHVLVRYPSGAVCEMAAIEVRQNGQVVWESSIWDATADETGRSVIYLPRGENHLRVSADGCQELRSVARIGEEGEATEKIDLTLSWREGW